MNITIDASVFISATLTALITWDGEMLRQGAAVVTTMTPSDWLKAQQTNPN